MALEESFSKVYTKFKLHFYQEIFSRFQDCADSLSAVENFCMEIILALNGPTINEFSSFVRISAPNAAYKVNSLIQKGYLEKIQSSQDRREYHLRPTQKYMDYFNISTSYVKQVMDRVKDRFTPQESEELSKLLQVLEEELMPDLRIQS